MLGGAGNDSYTVDSSGDVIDEQGNIDTGDLVTSSISVDLNSVQFGSGAIENVSLIGTANLSATGTAENNFLTGNTGANSLDGGAGDDNDTYYVDSAGDVTYVVDSVGDVIDEEGNSDTGDLVEANISIDLRSVQFGNGAVENATLMAGSGDLNITGSDSNNILTGNEGANTLSGLDGDDELVGAAGDDILDGGAGDDTMRGGAGNDIFRYDNVRESSGKNVDRITDFSTRFDTINLHAIDANTHVGGNQNFHWIGSDTFSGTAGELRFVQVDRAGTAHDATWIYADIDGNHTIDFAIRLNGLKDLTSACIVE